MSVNIIVARVLPWRRSNFQESRGDQHCLQENHQLSCPEQYRFVYILTLLDELLMHVSELLFCASESRLSSPLVLGSDEFDCNYG
ncbi:hypothetical protein HRI_004079800 [Hibiscus trionum]|uniref:Uncharacterized protein n=1 Tax=Hibiscus trionum TaxID=183268 RepID=A0A9W7MNU0_HIBTR|nr:hypothetical protein HRI_004079800 [Hibiscus trionum]